MRELIFEYPNLFTWGLVLGFAAFGIGLFAVAYKLFREDGVD